MRWPHFDHVFFDCDSTLTTIEGIDILAERSGKKEAVEALTQAAMNGEVDLNEVYARRLDVVQPTREAVNAIRHAYKHHIVEDARAVLAILDHFNIRVYVISGGLYEPVAEFAAYLGIPRDHVRAVGVEYDQLSGEWWYTDVMSAQKVRYRDFDNGPLTVSHGKAAIVRELLGEQRGRSLLVGDGTSDLLAGGAVDLFVGFGGVIERERVSAEAPAYIHSPSLAPVLLLACGPGLLETIRHTEHEPILNKVNQLISEGALSFNDEQLGKKFLEAYSAVYPGTN